MKDHPVRVNCRSGISGVGVMYNLIETLCSTETCWSSANDKNIDIAIKDVSKKLLCCLLALRCRS